MKQEKCSSLTFQSAVVLLLFSLPPLTAVAVAAPTCGELVKGKCLACHYETRICQKIKKGKGKRSWKKTIKSMIRHGAAVNKDEQKSLVTCLSKQDSEVLALCGMKK